MPIMTDEERDFLRLPIVDVCAICGTWHPSRPRIRACGGCHESVRRLAEVEKKNVDAAALGRIKLKKRRLV